MEGPCPCGSGNAYDQCCGRFIEGQALPATPEELMRSRYVAYTLANIGYIENTMAGPALRNFNSRTAFEWATSVNWKKLEVIKSSSEGPQGSVEFIAHFEQAGVPQTIHEASDFYQDQGKWYYIDGKSFSHKPYVAHTAVGRNDPCPCGSGKKYKKCCL